MASLIAAGGSGRSTSVMPAVPAVSSVTTIAFIRDLPLAGRFIPRADGRSRPPSPPPHRHWRFPHRRLLPGTVTCERYSAAAAGHGVAGAVSRAKADDGLRGRVSDLL